MEAAKAAGMATGVAVTSSVTDATPAAFTSHARRRALHASIALQYAVNKTADVVLGGGRRYFGLDDLPHRMTQEAGYAFVTDRAGLRAVSSAPVLGLFGDVNMPWELDRNPATTPSLAEMAVKAVELLQAKGGERGFFLVVEGSKIDKAAHPNDLATHLREIIAYDEAVGAMLDAAERLGDTLVVSTSDHETGGASIGRSEYNRSGSSAGDWTYADAEAPMRNEDLRAEASGLAVRHYPDLLHLGPLHSVTASSEAMVNASLLAVGDPCVDAPCDQDPQYTTYRAWVAGLNGSETSQLELVAALQQQLTSAAGGLGSLDTNEVAMLREAVSLFPQLGSYGLIRSLGAIISARAGVGWTTWGHTGTDVMLLAQGPGEQLLHGSIENVEIGRRIALLMQWNLSALTKTLGVPLIAQRDREDSKLREFANWR